MHSFRCEAMCAAFPWSNQLSSFIMMLITWRTWSHWYARVHMLDAKLFISRRCTRKTSVWRALAESIKITWISPSERSLIEKNLINVRSLTWLLNLMWIERDLPSVYMVRIALQVFHFFNTISLFFMPNHPTRLMTKSINWKQCPGDVHLVGAFAL